MLGLRCIPLGGLFVAGGMTHKNIRHLEVRAYVFLFLFMRSSLLFVACGVGFQTALEDDVTLCTLSYDAAEILSRVPIMLHTQIHRRVQGASIPLASAEGYRLGGHTRLPDFIFQSMVGELGGSVASGYPQVYPYCGRSVESLIKMSR